MGAPAQNQTVNSVTYSPVSPMAFPRITGPLRFNVYLKLRTNKYTKVFSQGAEVDVKRLEGYILKGTSSFYILSADRKLFLAEALNVLDNYRRAKTLDREECHHIIDEVAEKTLAQIYDTQSFDQVSLELCANVAQAYIEVAKEHPKALPALIKLARTKKTNLKHSMMTSIFATLLALQTGRIEEDKLWQIGFAGLVHDIGMSFFSDDIDEHDLKLPPDLAAKLKQHPKQSIEILKGAGSISPEIEKAILQHHEAFDGTGYPKGLQGEDITLEARIITVADSFTRLLLGAEEGMPLPPSLAIMALQNGSKYDPELVKSLGALLRL